MKQIVSIQALRAVAALSVAYGHAAYDALLLAQRQGRAFDPAYRELSAAGVDLFFVISGFVMVWSSRELFGRPGAGATFFGRRLARIVPLYWVTTTVFLAAMALLPAAMNSAPPSLAEIMKSYLFVPFTRADDGAMQPIYRLGWTLNYEMFFYACFALLVALPARRAVATLTAVFVALVVMGHVARPEATPLRFWSQPIILEFVLGALVGAARLAGLRLPPVARWGLILLAAAWFTLGTGGAFPTGPFERLVVLGGASALLLAAFALTASNDAPTRGARPLVVLGDASYALYLIHPIVIRGFSVIWTRAGLGDAGGGWLFIVAALAVSAAMSVVVYRLFERPVTRWLQARLRPG